MQTRIKDLRKQKNMSQLTLAVKIGCSQNSISKIERDEADPRGSLLIEMSELFGVSIDYILGISEKETSVQNNYRLVRAVEMNREYLEKYLKLSTDSKHTVNVVVDRLMKVEEMI